LDYDNDFNDYYDDEDRDIPMNTHVTPIQGPIFLKNNTVPVIPLYSYPQLNNGTFVQIPVSNVEAKIRCIIDAPTMTARKFKIFNFYSST